MVCNAVRPWFMVEGGSRRVKSVGQCRTENAWGWLQGFATFVHISHLLAMLRHTTLSVPATWRWHCALEHVRHRPLANHLAIQ